MQQFLWYGGIGVALGVAVGAVLWWRRRHPGISDHNLRRRLAKEESKAKILDMVAEKGEVTNSQVQDALRIGDSTTTRYLEELERQGRIEQVGDAGRFVKYKMK